MTDEQIMEALKCCSDFEYSSCTECPLFMVGKECPIVLHSNVLALIERQKAEIEKLIDECGSQSVLWRDNFASVYETAKESIKAEARAKAIREFAERLYAKEDRAACSVSIYDIRDTVREMTEEQK